MFGILVLYLMRNQSEWFINNLVSEWVLTMPALFTFFMFSLVHLEQRYIGAFVVIFLLGLISGIQLKDSPELNKLTEVILLTITIMLMITTGITTAKEISIWQKNWTTNSEWEIASSLKKLGVNEQDKVATIGYNVPDSAYWARLAKVKIISEITIKDANLFWEANDKLKEKVINLISTTDAKVIVASTIPEHCPKAGWQKLGSSNSYVYFLR